MKNHLILLCFLIIMSACAGMRKNEVFNGRVLRIDTAPLAIDGDAEVDIEISKDKQITFYFVSCNPPSTCNSKAIELLTSGQVGIGDEVEISAHLWKYEQGEKFLIEREDGYIKKL